MEIPEALNSEDFCLKAMEMSPIVNHIAGFLRADDVCSLAQTQKHIHADLKQLIRKNELAALKEHGKLKYLLAVMSKAACEIHFREEGPDDFAIHTVCDSLDDLYDLDGLRERVNPVPFHEWYKAVRGGTVNLSPVPEECDTIARYLLDQMD